MASCSRAFAMKRPRVSKALFEKRRRTTPFSLSGVYCRGSCSSSEEESSDVDEQSGYDLQQVRAKRRASTRKLFVAGDSELSKACSLYSDDEDCNSSRFHALNMHSSPRKPFISSVASTGTGTIVAAPLSMPRKPLPSDGSHLAASAPPSSPIMRKAELSPHPTTRKPECPEYRCPSSSASLNGGRCSDLQARMRCFDYLVGAIDEAWARYCNATTNMEDQVYGYDIPKAVACHVGDDDDDDEDDDDDDAYLSGSSNGTELTDYDTDIEHPQKRAVLPQPPRPRLLLSGSMCSNADDLSTPSGQLLALKDRLTKAKYFLQDLVDSDHTADVSCFWKRWDMIKYATIELVEDDDDDEVVETTIDDLEKGRVNVH